MQDVITKYQGRLVNISGGNRSLVLKRLYNKRSFNLHLVDKISAHKTSEIISYLFNRDRTRLLLLEDAYGYKQVHQKILLETLNRELKLDLEKIEHFHSGEVPSEKIEELTEKYNLKRKKHLKLIDENSEHLITYGTSINYLYREINATERETGRHELLVGYPFIEGSLHDGTFVRAPLFLFPVRLFKENNRWFLQNLDGSSPQLNKVFLTAYAKANEVSLPEIELDVLAAGDALESINNALDLLKNVGININALESVALQQFTEYTRDNTPEYSPGELNLKHYIILGQFPTSNSIYLDYTKLLDKDLSDTAIEHLIKSSSHESLQDDFEEKDLEEQDYYFISPLDYSQEKAVQQASLGKHLVIHGPPGTGKSETIANIIMDMLARDKRVLMVSQKRAALDVVHNRLADIHSKTVLIHDATRGKKDFYQHVAHSLKSIDLKKNVRIPDSIKEFGKKVDEELSLLQRSWSVMHKKHKCGLTLQQMYVLGTGIDYESIVEFLVKLRSDNPFEGCLYKELEQSAKKLKNNDGLSDYSKLRHLIRKKPYLKFVKAGADKISVLTAEHVLNQLDHKGLEKLKSHTKYNEVIKVLKNRDYGTIESSIENLVVDFMSRHDHLLQPINDGKWWSPKFWLKYRENKRKQMEQQQEYQKRFADVSTLLMDIVDYMKRTKFVLSQMDNIFTLAGIDNIVQQLLERDSVEVIGEVKEVLTHILEYNTLSMTINRLSPGEKAIAKWIYNLTPKIHKTISERKLDKFLQAYLIHTLEEHRGEIQAHQFVVSGRSYEQKVAEIRQYMESKRAAVPVAIERRWSRRFSESQRPIRQLMHQATKKRGLWPIRRYISEFNENIFTLFPCWLMGPEAVSDILPLDKGLFDVIIFDEASQMFVENSIPAIYRAKQIIIAGDDKQLRPDDHFLRKFDDDGDDDDLVLDMAAATEVESLLDLAKVNFENVHLNYHYRARYSELIDFSNYGFYNGQLHVSPNTFEPEVPVIERIKVNGHWSDKRNNQIEAEQVVELIDHLLRNRTEEETIGVVTFNRNQKNLIEDLLDHKALTDPAFGSAYREEISRKEGNQDVGLFVKNIENVQGDERDIVIFSVAYAPNINHRLSVNFGSLNREGGANRLNVAISRAKKKIYLVTSIEPEELNVEQSTHAGPRLFKAYLQYVRAVSNKNIEEQKQILNTLVDSGAVDPQEGSYDSAFEQEVAESLREKGFKIHSQVGVSGYRIDLGVYDSELSRYILGIECDGATYHSAKSARERDIHRQNYLESRGWTIARVWSTDWWENPRREVIRLIEHINLQRDKLVYETKYQEQITLNTREESPVLQLRSPAPASTVHKTKKTEPTNGISECEATRTSNKFW